jgi:hypothetical protein
MRGQSKLTFCDEPGCVELARTTVLDQIEVEAPVGEWRVFVGGKPHTGCLLHTPVARAYYLDGRVLRVSECQSERVPENPRAIRKLPG